MNRFTLLLPALALVACSDKTQLDPNYCGHQDGDSYCARQDPGRPYCVLGFDECFEAAGLPEFSNGCVAEPPTPECSTPCGIGNEDGCTDPTEGSSSSGSTTDEPSSTTEAETDTETEGPTTTTGPECMDNAECMDAALPFCIEQTCSPCSASVDVTPDEACASLDEATPLCVDDTCVQCTAENASACSGTTPLCSAESNTCVACSFHEECQAMGSPACNLATGACFDPDAVTEVSLSSANAIQNAITAVPNGAEHAVVITGGSGLHTITVDGGKTIAIVSDSTTVRSIQGNSGSPGLRVSSNNTSVFLHRVRLFNNADDVGIEVTSGASLFADSTQVAQNAGGGITLASGTSAQLRNCMVAGEGGDPGIPAVTSTGGTLDILYSTLGLDFNNGGPTLECSGGTVTVRNSIVVSDSSVAGSASLCPSADIQASFVDNDSGADAWFASIGTGNYTLTAAGQTQFDGFAVWQDGDPPFDFDGDARPNVDGTADYAGADVP